MKKSSYSERFVSLYTEALKKAHEVLATLPKRTLVLDEPILLYVHKKDCPGTFLLAKTIFLASESLQVFSSDFDISRLDKDGGWDNLLPNEYWGEDGDWNVEWEGMFKLLDAIINTKTKNSAKAKNYIAYTDGGYSRMNNVGAGAFVVLSNNDIVLKGGRKITDATNNVAELTAILALVQTIYNHSVIKVITDSQYAIGVLSGAYNPSKNIDLINKIKEVIKAKDLTVTYEWVKGHSGNKYNEMCDRMCNTIAGCNLNEEYKKFMKK